MDRPERALVVTPHPDDAEIGCGGTVAGWIAEGTEVYYVLCTNGDKGTSDPDLTSERLAEIREREQAEAAEVLGIKEVVYLRYPDGGLEDTSEFRERLVHAIRRFTPRRRLCHRSPPAQLLPSPRSQDVRDGDDGRCVPLRARPSALP